MSGSKKRRDNRTGFLLIELLAAALILSTALIVLSRSFSNSAGLLRHASFLLRAESLLEQELLEFEEAPSLEEGPHEGTLPGPEPFHWTAEIQKKSEPSLYQIALTVSWKEGRRSDSLTVTTLLEKQPQTP